MFAQMIANRGGLSSLPAEHTQRPLLDERALESHISLLLSLYFSFLLSIIMFLFNFINVPDVRRIMQHNPNPKSEQY